MPRPFRFAAPAPAAGTLLRPRLLTTLARRWEHRLIAVEAGPGFGKTTLLAQAVTENSLDPQGRDVWLTAEPDDASGSTFAGALLAGLGAADDHQIPTVDAVCEAVWAAAPSPVCLVVDDVHVVADGSPGFDALLRLVDQLPDNGHLLVAGRSLAALPRARLVAQGRAVELTEDDLRLSDAELADLAAVHLVDPALLQNVGGWPALATLWATAGRAHAERFVSEEVLGQLDAADREAFILLVAVGGGDPAVLDAAAGRPVDRAALARLPLVATDGENLRPHALWETLLAGELAHVDVGAARRRVATALLGRGEPGAAFELLAAAGDWDSGLTAMFDACNDQRRPPWRDVLERWRAMVPADLDDRPEVSYLDAMIIRDADPWSRAGSDAFDVAIEGFRARGDIAREASASVRASFVHWLQGDVEWLVTLRGRGQDMLAAGIPVQDAVLLNDAIRADVQARSDDLLHLTDTMALTEPRLRHFPPMLRVLARLATGHAGVAADDAAAAAAAAAPVWPAGGTGWAMLCPALVAWATGDLASPALAALDDPGPRIGRAERVIGLTLAAVVASHRGDRGRAADLLALTDDLTATGTSGTLLDGLRAVAQATAAAADGDEDAATRVLDSAFGDGDFDPAGPGRAVLWFPAVPWLFHPGARRFLVDWGSGPTRQRILDTVEALRAARVDGSTTPNPLLDSPEALLCALPPPLAVESALHGLAAGDARAEPALRRLVELVPAAGRQVLGRLAAHGDKPVQRAAAGALRTIAISPPFTLRIEALGPGRLLRDGAVVDHPDWRRERVRHIILALVAHREIRRDRLGVLLWPDADDEFLSTNLRTTLTYVQRVLEPDRERGGAPWFLQQDAGVLHLAGGAHLEVDAWEFDNLLAEAQAAAEHGVPSVELDRLRSAVDLWHGDYLDDLSGEEWAEPYRLRFRANLVHAAVRAAELLTAAGRVAEAERRARTAVDADPYAEAAYRALAAAHLAGGDLVLAAATLDECERRLDEIGAPPDAKTLALRRRLTPA